MPPTTAVRCRMADKTAMTIIMHVVTAIVSAAIAATENIYIGRRIHRNHPAAVVAHVTNTPGQATQ